MLWTPKHSPSIHFSYQFNRKIHGFQLSSVITFSQSNVVTFNPFTTSVTYARHLFTWWLPLNVTYVSCRFKNHKIIGQVNWIDFFIVKQSFFILQEIFLWYCKYSMLIYQGCDNSSFQRLSWAIHSSVILVSQIKDKCCICLLSKQLRGDLLPLTIQTICKPILILDTWKLWYSFYL